MRRLTVLTLALVTVAATHAAAEPSVLGNRLRLDLLQGRHVSGELLAVDKERLWLLSSGDEHRVLRLGEISRARVPRPGLSAKGVMLWTLIGGAASGGLLTGACTSVSGDCGGVFPAVFLSWAVWGGLSAAIAGSSWRDVDAGSLAPYARFPQGMPEGFMEDAVFEGDDAGSARRPRHAESRLAAAQPVIPRTNWGRVRAEYR